MDALDVMKVCLRRWYVMVPVVLLALAAGVGLAQHQQPVYTAFGTYAVVYTQADAIKANLPDPRNANPLGGDGATLLGEALEAEYMSADKQQALGGAGNSGVAPSDTANGTSYSVTLPQDSQTYLVQTWGHDPAALRKVVNGVLSSSTDTAREIQDRAGAPPKSQYITFTTSKAQLNRLPTSSKAKVVIALGGLGLLAGSSLSIVTDGILRRRRRAGVAGRDPVPRPRDTPRTSGGPVRPSESKRPRRTAGGLSKQPAATESGPRASNAALAEVEEDSLLEVEEILGRSSR